MNGTSTPGGVTPAPLKEAVGRHGVGGAGLRAADAEGRAERADAVAELEDLGFGAVWLGGDSSAADARPLLRATSHLVVGTGTPTADDGRTTRSARDSRGARRYDGAGANERAGQPGATGEAYATGGSAERPVERPAEWATAWARACAAEFAEAEAVHPGRTVLVLEADDAREAEPDQRPYAAPAARLDALDALDALDSAGLPAGRRVLAAGAPQLLEAARDRAAGAVPYLVTPEYTARARGILGEGPLLAPELPVILEPDPARARALARTALLRHLAPPARASRVLRLGFTEEDLADGGSGRLVDAVFVWGDDARVRDRVATYHAAGADHVTLRVIDGRPRRALRREMWRRLASLLE